MSYLAHTPKFTLNVKGHDQELWVLGSRRTLERHRTDFYPETDPAYDRRVELVIGDWSARNVPLGEPGSVRLGSIRAGTRFDIIEERDGADGYRFSKGRIVEGEVGEHREGAEIWFATQQHGRPVCAGDGRPRFSSVKAPERRQPAYWQGMVNAEAKEPGGLDLYHAPANGTFGVKFASEPWLPNGYPFRFDSEKTQLVTFKDGSVRPIAECTTEITRVRDRPVPPTFWAYVDDITVKHARVEPARLDSVIVPAKPIPIKAGDPIGYLGLHEMSAGLGKKNTRHHVHLEVFTCDPGLNAFLDNEAGLTQGKQYLEVLKLQAAIVGRDTRTGHPSYLFRDHLFDLKKIPVVKDENGVDAYKITVQEKARSQGSPPCVRLTR